MLITQMRLESVSTIETVVTYNETEKDLAIMILQLTNLRITNECSGTKRSASYLKDLPRDNNL